MPGWGGCRVVGHSLHERGRSTFADFQRHQCYWSRPFRPSAIRHPGPAPGASLTISDRPQWATLGKTMTALLRICSVRLEVTISRAYVYLKAGRWELFWSWATGEFVNELV